MKVTLNITISYMSILGGPDGEQISLLVLLEIIFSIVVGMGKSENEVIWDNSETLLLSTIFLLNSRISGSSILDLQRIFWVFKDSGIASSTLCWKFADWLLWSFRNFLRRSTGLGALPIGLLQNGRRLFWKWKSAPKHDQARLSVL